MTMKPDYGLRLKKGRHDPSLTIFFADWHVWDITVLGPGRFRPSVRSTLIASATLCRLILVPNNFPAYSPTGRARYGSRLSGTSIRILSPRGQLTCRGQFGVALRHTWVRNNAVSSRASCRSSLIQCPSRWRTELDSERGADPVADRQNGVEVVDLHRPADSAEPRASNL